MNLLRPGFALLVTASLMNTACGPTCAESCRRFYSEDQCDAAPVGKDANEAIAECTKQCQDALQVPGSPVSSNDARFNPNLRAPLNQSYELANEEEAAAWMDCVWSFSDEECPVELENQACVPIFGS
ncbi:MAG: hypothetical protein ACON5B_14520 [Myxococcota bacterium]